jgi:hypothetical protein
MRTEEARKERMNKAASYKNHLNYDEQIVITLAWKIIT